ncbi:MAG: hypothetical protein ABFQ89_03120 [Chloroflexota bacterium]
MIGQPMTWRVTSKAMLWLYRRPQSLKRLPVISLLIGITLGGAFGGFLALSGWV